jgi:hypothetical protein
VAANKTGGRKMKKICSDGVFSRSYIGVLAWDSAGTARAAEANQLCHCRG